MLSQLTTVPTFAPQSTTLRASWIAIIQSLETLRCLQQLLSFIPGLAWLTLRTIGTLICNWAEPGRPKEVSETTTTIGIVMPLYPKRHNKYRTIKRQRMKRANTLNGLTVEGQQQMMLVMSLTVTIALSRRTLTMSSNGG